MSGSGPGRPFAAVKPATDAASSAVRLSQGVGASERLPGADEGAGAGRPRGAFGLVGAVCPEELRGGPGRAGVAEEARVGVQAQQCFQDAGRVVVVDAALVTLVVAVGGHVPDEGQQTAVGGGLPQVVQGDEERIDVARYSARYVSGVSETSVWRHRWRVAAKPSSWTAAR